MELDGEITLRCGHFSLLFRLSKRNPSEVDDGDRPFWTGRQNGGHFENLNFALPIFKPGFPTFLKPYTWCSYMYLKPFDWLVHVIHSIYVIMEIIPSIPAHLWNNRSLFYECNEAMVEDVCDGTGEYCFDFRDSYPSFVCFPSPCCFFYGKVDTWAEREFSFSIMANLTWKHDAMVNLWPILRDTSW